MSRNPLLAAADGRVRRLPRARQTGERLLPDVVPVDQVDARGLHGGLGTGHAGNQQQREIEPGGAAAGHQQTLALAGRYERRIPTHAHAGVALLEHVAVRPVRGRLPAVEQAGFGEQDGAGTGRGNRRAPFVAGAEPGRFDVEASVDRLTGRHGQLGNADVVEVERDVGGAWGSMRTPLAARKLPVSRDTTTGRISDGPGLPSTICPQSRPADMNRSYMP